MAGMKSLDAMLSWVVKRKGGRAVVGQAIEALREVFLTALLPDRKLRFLSQQPLRALAAGREGDRRLLYWHLEDCIKKRCARRRTAAVGAGSNGPLHNMLGYIEKESGRPMECSGGWSVGAGG